MPSFNDYRDAGYTWFNRQSNLIKNRAPSRGYLKNPRATPYDITGYQQNRDFYTNTRTQQLQGATERSASARALSAASGGTGSEAALQHQAQLQGGKRTPPPAPPSHQPRAPRAPVAPRNTAIKYQDPRDILGGASKYEQTYKSLNMNTIAYDLGLHNSLKKKMAKYGRFLLPPEQYARLKVEGDAAFQRDTDRYNTDLGTYNQNLATYGQDTEQYNKDLAEFNQISETYQKEIGEVTAYNEQLQGNVDRAKVGAEAAQSASAASGRRQAGGGGGGGSAYKTALGEQQDDEDALSTSPGLGLIERPDTVWI